MSHGAPGTSPTAVGDQETRSAERAPSPFETRRHARVYARLRAVATLLRMRATRGAGSVGAIPHGEEPAVAQARAGVSNHEGARIKRLTISSRICRASA